MGTIGLESKRKDITDRLVDPYEYVCNSISFPIIYPEDKREQRTTRRELRTIPSRIVIALGQ